MGAALLERHKPEAISTGCIAELGGGEHFLASKLGDLPLPILDENRAMRGAPASLAVVFNDRQLPSDAPAGRV